MSKGEIWVDEPKPFKRRENSVQAIKVTEENAKEVAKWCGGEAKVSRINSGRSPYLADKNSTEPILFVPALEGVLDVFNGEWLLRGEDGRFRVMMNADFNKEFEYDSPEAPHGTKPYFPPGVRAANKEELHRDQA